MTDQGRPGYDTGWRVYRRLLSYAFQYWPLLIIATVTMVIMAMTEAGFAALMKPLMDESFGVDESDFARWIPLLLIVLFAVRGVAEFGATYSMRYVGRQVVKRLRTELFERLLVMPVQRFQHQSSGELISRLTYNVEQVASAATDGFSVLVKDSLTILVLLAWMFYLSAALTMTVLVIVPAVVLLVNVVTRQFRRLSHRIQGNMSDVTHVTQEVIEGHRVVRIFGGEPFERERFEGINEGNRRLHMRMEGVKAAYVPIIQFIVALVLAFIIWMATSDSLADDITAGTFVSFLTAMLLLLTPIRRLSTINATLQRGIAAGQNIFAVLDEAPERDTGHTPMEGARGALRFEQVSFRYEAGGPDVLKDIDLAIEPGENVALVGRSGSGKTTLVNLLPRFFTPTRGRILLDGHDLSDLRLRDLRRQIAYVGQHVTLFADTVANNIAYGRVGTTLDEIRKAAAAAHALDFIEQLPDGFDTEIGENGVLLSGGQRQRLAIARALLRDAPLLILDEATSALDNESERKVQAALANLMHTRTTLIIAHRLSTIEHADRILVLDAGRIVEQGQHADLLARDGIYTHLYRLQFREA
ncbi:lipid A export permease/ATP-binding protein MsbA [Thioalkalivibrio paradoxus]|uniref:ATP-binding protein n=1 Tax=Thioalkalivibrio paradoxus ARh 1 TaxID=713585 RepID=W0DPS7_9GAMM|nr:lipid A export permease/ATP-binding protein MsbA [Thioalkalivibrio paradoxus]AHE98870.1 ATP-binding protein [Thioalkalivibrio paradoxus ARh 1]